MLGSKSEYVQRDRLIDGWMIARTGRSAAQTDTHRYFYLEKI